MGQGTIKVVNEKVKRIASDVRKSREKKAEEKKILFQKTLKIEFVGKKGGSGGATI